MLQLLDNLFVSIHYSHEQMALHLSTIPEITYLYAQKILPHSWPQTQVYNCVPFETFKIKFQLVMLLLTYLLFLLALGFLEHQYAVLRLLQAHTQGVTLLRQPVDPSLQVSLPAVNHLDLE